MVWMALHNDVWMQVLQPLFCVYRVDGKRKRHLLVDNNVNLDALHCFTVQQTIQSEIFVFFRWSSQVLCQQQVSPTVLFLYTTHVTYQFRCQPPIRNIDFYLCRKNGFCNCIEMIYTITKNKQISACFSLLKQNKHTTYFLRQRTISLWHWHALEQMNQNDDSAPRGSHFAPFPCFPATDLLHASYL